MTRGQQQLMEQEGERVNINPELSLSIHYNISTIAKTWDSIPGSNDLFLSASYLRAIQQYPPKRMKLAYLIFWKYNKPAGKAYFQLQSFDAYRSLRLPKPEKGYFQKLVHSLKVFMLKQFKYNVLVSGNLLATGEHGFYFYEKLVPFAEQQALLRKGSALLRKDLEQNGRKIHISLFKDFYREEHRFGFRTLRGLHEFTIQPAMSMDIRSHWNTFEDYLKDLSSKYRVRRKRAFKKAGNIQKKALTIEEIEAHMQDIQAFYENMAERSGFNVVYLNTSYLLSLKRAFPEDFKLTAYYLDNQFVGYFTTLLNGPTLDAHFLGFKNELNRKHQLYLNMLYDIIKEGIEQKAENIHFARTALEIKSSVGAVATDLFCYAQYHNPILNILIAPAFYFLRPKMDWVPRSPFKN